MNLYKLSSNNSAPRKGYLNPGPGKLERHHLHMKADVILAKYVVNKESMETRYCMTVYNNCSKDQLYMKEKISDKYSSYIQRKIVRIY